jgi:hypothetical protein
MALMSAGILAVAMLAAAATAEDYRPNWPTSPYHGAMDGNGRRIPCQCLFRGHAHPLGTTVCMTTHKGTVLTVCDLVQNNSSWVPTDQPCTVSQGRSRGLAGRLATPQCSPL